MLSPDYQEFANRGSPATRDNTVISGLGTGEVTEITPALLDCHEKQARKRNFLLVAGRKTEFRNAPTCPNVNATLRSTTTPEGAAATDPSCYRGFAAGSSARLSITLSTRPNSFASLAVRNLSRSSASSIVL